MIAAKNLDNGLKYSRQAFFALTDMRYHMEPTTNTTEVWHDGMKKMSEGRRIIGDVGDGRASVTVTNYQGTINFLRR